MNNPNYYNHKKRGYHANSETPWCSWLRLINGGEGGIRTREGAINPLLDFQFCAATYDSSQELAAMLAV